MFLKASIGEDLQEIAEWQVQDPWRVSAEPPEWWTTGADCLLACKVSDAQGTLAYVRVHEEGEDSLRLWTLFAPNVPRKRMAIGICEFMLMLKQLASANGRGIATQSENLELRNFLVSRLGFKETDSTNGLAWSNN